MARALPHQANHDREIVETKRDRYLGALVAAQTAPPLPYMPDVLQLQLEHAPGPLHGRPKRVPPPRAARGVYRGAG